MYANKSRGIRWTQNRPYVWAMGIQRAESGTSEATDPFEAGGGLVWAVRWLPWMRASSWIS